MRDKIRELVVDAILDSTKLTAVVDELCDKLNKNSSCMYCEKKLKENEAIVLCKECTEQI